MPSIRPFAAAAVLVAPVLLAGCGRPADDAAPDTGTNAAATAGNAAQTVLALPEGQRTAVFLRAIRDAGQDCQTVTKSAQVAAAPPTWQATCDDGRQWIVSIDAAGTATVAARSK